MSRYAEVETIPLRCAACIHGGPQCDSWPYYHALTLEIRGWDVEVRVGSNAVLLHD